MKKIILLTICMLSFTAVSAQVTFKPGARGGVNISHFSKGDDAYYSDFSDSRRDFNSTTNFYIGLYGELKLSKFYSLQPEINYTRQGSEYKYYDEESMSKRSEKLEISYLSISAINKFNFNRVNVHLGPTLDFVVDKNFDADAEVDLAFVLGAGFKITEDFGIEGRVKKGIIPVLDYSDGNHTNVVFSLGVTYTFDTK